MNEYVRVVEKERKITAQKTMESIIDLSSLVMTLGVDSLTPWERDVIKKSYLELGAIYKLVEGVK